MTHNNRVIDPAALASRLATDAPHVLDLRKLEDYQQGHIPGAVHLDRTALVHKSPPVGGLLPAPAELARVLGSVGLQHGQEVVVYDEEGGGWGGRLMWTLDALGHSGSYLLDGGWVSWSAEGFPVQTTAAQVASTTYEPGTDPSVIAEREYIQQRLGSDDLVLLDTRTAEEFAGSKCLATRGGHIPGAVNLDWVEAMDKDRNLRLKPELALRELLLARGVTPDKEVVVYCQTHHRSSHTYVMLKHLGYPRVRGYPGAWSDWGNQVDTPVAT